MKLKGLVETNGYFSYQRSVPKDIADHPVFGGKKLYKKPLGVNLQTDEDIHRAWLEQHKAFESLTSNLRKDNLPLLEARKLAEDKAKLIGLNKLVNKLTLKNKKIKYKNLEVLQLVDYLKINSEANSDTRYVANFDICFNRKLIIEYFHKNKLQYAETYRKPISILPVFIKLLTSLEVGMLII